MKWFSNKKIFPQKCSGTRSGPVSKEKEKNLNAYFARPLFKMTCLVSWNQNTKTLGTTQDFCIVMCIVSPFTLFSHILSFSPCLLPTSVSCFTQSGRSFEVFWLQKRWRNKDFKTVQISVPHRAKKVQALSFSDHRANFLMSTKWGNKATEGERINKHFYTKKKTLRH